MRIPLTVLFLVLATVGPAGAIDITGGGSPQVTCVNQFLRILTTTTGTCETVTLTTDVTGVLPAASFPALSGNVTTVAGSLTTTIAPLAVTNAMLAGSIAASKLIGTDIATVGTITTGTWTGTTVAVASGGTGLTAGTSGGVLAYTATGTLASSAALTANALVLGGGAGVVPSSMASLGTTTTVLHGNAAGAPTFGAVALATDVSGTLAAAQFPALTGAITTTAGSLATTLQNTGPGATGPIGSATVAPVITIDAQGRVTALTSATITSGVLSSDSPTWTGQHTFTAAGTGPKIRLTDVDSQIFIGTTTDGVWTVPAIQVGANSGAGTGGGSLHQDNGTGWISLGTNIAGTGATRIAADASMAIRLQSSNILFAGGATGAAGGAITLATIATMTQGGGVQIGAPTGGDQGAGTLNMAGAYYSNGTVGTSGTATMCASGACATTCTIIFVLGIRTGGTC